MNNRPLFNLWLGLCLGSLFFYPITSTLNDEPYYMMWNARHSAEAAVSWVLIAAAATIALTASRRNPQKRGFFLLFLATIALPFISFLLHFSRQVKLYEKVQISSLAIITYGLLAVLATGLALICCIPACSRWRERMVAFFSLLLLIMSPLSVLSATTLITNAHSPDIPAPSHAYLGAGEAGDTIFILFDEMSYEFLYSQQTGKVSPEFPNIGKFTAESDNYHDAISPGTNTLTAMPGLLTGRNDLNSYIKGSDIYFSSAGGRGRPLRETGSNIFLPARSKGFRTVLCGNYHDYRRFFNVPPDEIKSYSLYNYGTIHEKFSLLNPIRTTIGMWPYMNPPGLLKRPVFALQQRDCVEKTASFFRKTINGTEPCFCFFHFSIPHVPFVFDRNGFHYRNDCFVNNSQNYTNQLMYVDRLFGEMMEEVRKTGKYDKARIVLLSDHNYRNLTGKDKWSHIPLVVKNPHQNTRRDFRQRTSATDLINGLL